MAHKVHNIGVAKQIGAYSDAYEVARNARWLFSSGTAGLSLDGKLPADITGQAEIAWTHVMTLLDRAGMDKHDLVKVSHYLTRESDIADYVKVRSKFLGDLKPASMLAIIPALVRPNFLVEIEFIAATA
ncbi:MAG TPA: RidA family protein [Xanthobacteraceae bacterium]|nr:RidA family protein [Xanthobacteraceae bacterium]